jgi:hypothetical protein
MSLMVLSLISIRKDRHMGETYGSKEERDKIGTLLDSELPVICFSSDYSCDDKSKCHTVLIINGVSGYTTIMGSFSRADPMWLNDGLGIPYEYMREMTKRSIYTW